MKKVGGGGKGVRGGDRGDRGDRGGGEGGRGGEFGQGRRRGRGRGSGRGVSNMITDETERLWLTALSTTNLDSVVIALLQAIEGGLWRHRSGVRVCDSPGDTFYVA